MVREAHSMIQQIAGDGGLAQPRLRISEFGFGIASEVTAFMEGVPRGPSGIQPTARPSKLERRRQISELHVVLLAVSGSLQAGC